MINVEWSTIPGTYPKTVQELLTWPVGEGKDTYGNFTILTGFEGTGGCFWCGKELPEGRHRRYCPGKSHGDFNSCYSLHEAFFCWPGASSWCLRRYEHRCAFCGKEEATIDDPSGFNYRSNLEVHHIFPLEGQTRIYSPYNVPWNLIPLCHEHHQLVHAILRSLRGADLAESLDIFLVAKGVGQQIMEPFASVPKANGIQPHALIKI